MIDIAAIRPGMPVRDPDGLHIGTVDGRDGNCIRLSRTDPASGGEHRYLPLADIQAVERDAVFLKAAVIGTRDPPY